VITLSTRVYARITPPEVALAIQSCSPVQHYRAYTYREEDEVARSPGLLDRPEGVASCSAFLEADPPSRVEVVRSLVEPWTLPSLDNRDETRVRPRSDRLRP
jgi:hypothetical protein